MISAPLTRERARARAPLIDPVQLRLRAVSDLTSNPRASAHVSLRSARHRACDAVWRRLNVDYRFDSYTRAGRAEVQSANVADSANRDHLPLGDFIINARGESIVGARSRCVRAIISGVRLSISVEAPRSGSRGNDAARLLINVRHARRCLPFFSFLLPPRARQKEEAR